ncbi:ribonuclease III [soil metagenome]
MAPDRISEADLDTLAQRLDYRFRDEKLLKQALTHVSGPGGLSYERLEFLGDRVLGLVIAEELFERHPATPEGPLSYRLSTLVRGETCAAVARDIALHEFIRVGRGEAAGGLRQNTTVMGDVMEAVIAAIYRDGGFEAARAMILRLWERYLMLAEAPQKDPKSYLQEWALARALPLPAYREIGREGPDHQPMFEMELMLHGFAPAIGRAASKRAAEYAAAEEFLRREGVRQ